MKKIQDLKPVLHFKKDNYVYRYVLVDRFKHDTKYHYGFDTKEEKTEAESCSLFFSCSSCQVAQQADKNTVGVDDVNY